MRDVKFRQHVTRGLKAVHRVSRDGNSTAVLRIWL